MTQLKGICPIIATPFTKDGSSVDYESLEKELAFMGTHGCHGATLFGIAGEYYKLSEEEMNRMVRIVVDTCRKTGMKSIISVTTHATELAVRRAQYFQDQGADALMMLPPSFLKPSGEAVEYHMKAVSGAVRIPVVLQYAPAQTGVSIPPSVLAKIGMEAPTDIYYKIECKPAGAYTSTILGIIGNKPRVFLGNAGYQFIELFDRGAIGAMPGCSMFDLYLAIYDAYVAGDRKKAMDLHGRVLLPMLNHIRQDVEMIIAFEKRILYRRNIIASDYCRRPGFTSDREYDRLFDELYALTEPYLTAGKA